MIAPAILAAWILALAALLVTVIAFIQWMLTPATPKGTP